MRGQCQCGNLRIHWQNIDLSLVPRVCQCEFCRARALAWVSKSGTRVTLAIANPGLHRILHQGTATVDFHCCTFCDTLVMATCTSDGTTYGALNANCMANPQGFGEPVPVTLDRDPLPQRMERRRRNWCAPVIISRAALSS